MKWRTEATDHVNTRDCCSPLCLWQQTWARNLIMPTKGTYQSTQNHHLLSRWWISFRRCINSHQSPEPGAFVRPLPSPWQVPLAKGSLLQT